MNKYITLWTKFSQNKNIPTKIIYEILILCNDPDNDKLKNYNF